MTYLGKRKDSDKRESVKAENNAVNLVKKDDILKQSIKAAEFEDTSVFFVHSGLVLFIKKIDAGKSTSTCCLFLKVCLMLINNDCVSKLDSGRVDFIVGGIIHTVLLKSLYATLPASR